MMVAAMPVPSDTAIGEREHSASHMPSHVQMMMRMEQRMEMPVTQSNAPVLLLAEGMHNVQTSMNPMVIPVTRAEKPASRSLRSTNSIEQLPMYAVPLTAPPGLEQMCTDRWCIMDSYWTGNSSDISSDGAKPSLIEGGIQPMAAEDEVIQGRSRRRNRPSKTKRAQYKTFISSMLERIDSHPEICGTELFENALQELPPVFSQNERLKAKFIARCMTCAEQAQARKYNSNLDANIESLLMGTAVLSL